MKLYIYLLKLVLIIVITLQQLLLSYIMFSNKLFLYIFDVTFIIILTFYLASSKNNIHIYSIYIYIIVTKITIIYFISIPNSIIHNKSIYTYYIKYFNDVLYLIYAVTFTLLITVIVYIIFFYITNYNLLSIDTITVENILFLIIAVYVSIDIIDISDFFYNSYLYFLYYYFRLKDEYIMLSNIKLFEQQFFKEKNISKFYITTTNITEIFYITIGILISLNVFIHAYSLPNYSHEANIQQIGFIKNSVKKKKKYNEKQCNEKQCNEKQYNAKQYNTKQYNAKQYNAKQYNAKYRNKYKHNNNNNKNYNFIKSYNYDHINPKASNNFKSKLLTDFQFNRPKSNICNKKSRSESIIKALTNQKLPANTTSTLTTVPHSTSDIQPYATTPKIINISQKHIYNNFKINNEFSKTYNITSNTQHYDEYFLKKTYYDSKISGDALSCLKYISVCSFIFTNLNFCFVRLMNILLFSELLSSSFFIIKNICFIAICILRMYRKSKYNKGLNYKKKKNKNKIKNLYSKIDNNDIFAMNKNNQSEMENFDDESNAQVRHWYGGCTYKTYTLNTRKLQKRNTNEISYTFETYKTKSSILQNSYDSKILFSKTIGFNDFINIQDIEHSEYNKCTSLKYNHIKFYFNFLYLKYNGLNIKKYITYYFDNISRQSFKYSFFFFFFILLIAIKITIIVITYIFDFDQDFQIKLYDLTFNYNIKVIDECLMLQIIFFIISFYTISIFVIYTLTCSFFDALFMSLLHFSDLISFVFILIILSQINSGLVMFIHMSRNKNIMPMLFIFVRMVYLLLSDSYIFINMILGRIYITYNYKTKERKDIHSDANSYGNVSVTISIISLLIFKLIKYMNGPLILNKIIIGNNLIKNTRVDNFFYFRHIKTIIQKLIVYFLCFIFCFNIKSINIFFLCILYFINIILSVVYLVISKVYRNVAMDYMLTQSLFVDSANATIYSKDSDEENIYDKYSYIHLIFFKNSLNYF
ncbi:conserved membrane protein, unknown function [Hepatocystis sp. ex Piliocolobus tephrosceles]|nr:conserved membrane protein, unknown function [Hepatocystis sp. ex Piliocolobus tephrosceles]